MAEQDEPASFPEDGLWRRLLTRAQQGTHDHGFFVVDVVEGCMHTSMFCKLVLPALFMRHHYKSLNEKIILEGPDGHQWPTMLGLQLDSQPCLMHGWKEFAAEYNLEIKDQVVFLLFEYSHFLVQVYDVNNKVKRRVSASSPAKPGRADSDLKVKSVSTPAHRTDLHSFKTSSDLKVKSVSQATHHTELPTSVHGFKPSNFIQILDSSEEEEEEEEDRAPLNCKNMDAFKIVKDVKDILDSSDEEEEDEEDEEDEEEDEEVPSPRNHKKMDASKTVKEGGSKMTLRSAKKVDTEDHTWSKRMKSAQPSGKDQVKSKEDHVQSDNETVQSDDETVQSGDETGRIMDAILGRNNNADAIISAPSSPEPVLVLKRSRRLQRKSGDYEGDDLGRAATKVLRSGKLYKLSQKVPGAPPLLLYEEPANAFKRVLVNDEILTSCCSTQNSTMRHQRSFRQLHESTTSKDTTPKVTATPTESQDNVMELEGRSRHKTNDRGKKRLTEKQAGCSSEEEANKRPARVAEAPVKVHNLIYVSKRRPVTAQEKQETLEAAQAFAQTATNKHFVLQLKTTQVYCGFHLKVPPEFVDAMQLPLTRLKVTLNKKWDVEWLGDHPRRPGLHSAGWTKFVLEHYLEEGDVCVFQQCSTLPRMIYVQIFPIVPLVEPPERGWRSHYILPDQSQTARIHILE